MAGDSLIGFPAKWNSPNFKQLENLKAQFFSATDKAEKVRLKTAIDQQVQQNMTNSKGVFGYPVTFDFRLMFSEVWHKKGGFDLILGNPPYVQIQTFSGQPIQDYWKKQNYQSFTKTGDIYTLFYEQGWRLLRNGGLLCFITSNKWMRAAYGKKLRQFFATDTDTQPLQLIDFGGH